LARFPALRHPFPRYFGTYFTHGYTPISPRRYVFIHTNNSIYQLLFYVVFQLLPPPYSSLSRNMSRRGHLLPPTTPHPSLSRVFWWSCPPAPPSESPPPPSLDTRVGAVSQPPPTPLLLETRARGGGLVLHHLTTPSLARNASWKGRFLSPTTPVAPLPDSA